MSPIEAKKMFDEKMTSFMNNDQSPLDKNSIDTMKKTFFENQQKDTYVLWKNRVFASWIIDKIMRFFFFFTPTFWSMKKRNKLQQSTQMFSQYNKYLNNDTKQ